MDKPALKYLPFFGAVVIVTPTLFSDLGMWGYVGVLCMFLISIAVFNPRLAMPFLPRATRKKVLPILSILLVIAITFSPEPNSIPTNSTNSTNLAEGGTNSTNSTNSAELFRVSRVVDGDTIKLSTGETVRYIGIDTPETKHPKKPIECFGKEAAEKNSELVLDKRVTLKKDISEKDKYGRLLRYVYIGNIFVNEYLVKNGFAYASSYPPDISNQDIFVRAQEEAQKNHRGLWGNNPCPTGI